MIVKSQAVELLGWRSVKQCHHIRDYTHPERSYFNDFLSFIVFCSFWSSSNSCTSWLKFFIGWPSNTSSFQYCFFRLDASNLCLLVSASGRPWHILCTQVAISTTWFGQGLIENLNLLWPKPIFSLYTEALRKTPFLKELSCLHCYCGNTLYCFQATSWSIPF